MTHRLLPALFLTLSSLLLPACATHSQPMLEEPVVYKPVPHRTWVNLNYAIKQINDRANTLDTVLAVGDIMLTKANGKDSVFLQTAILLEKNDFLRLRAYKGDQPVMDITYTPQGVWVWTQRHAPELTFTRAALTQMIAAMRGSVPTDAQQVDENPQWISANATLPNVGSKVQFHIHKPTLTLTQYAYFDKDDKKRQTLVMDQYDYINFHPWPRRIRAEGEMGFMTIHLREVEINEALPPNAFVPPDRATRQP